MILDAGNYYAELKEDGTYVKHHCRFVRQGDITLRVELDPVTGKQAGALVVLPKTLFTVDVASGEIQGEQTGFVLDHELVEPVCPIPGKRYLRLADSELPADFKQSGVIAYIHDGTQFVPLLATELVRRIELKQLAGLDALIAGLS